MRKVLLVLSMVALTFSMNAQLNYNSWKSSSVIDDFGDPTGAFVKVLYGKGTFSNSVTSNSELIVRFTDWGDALTVAIFEYGRTPSASITYTSEYGIIRVKKEDGTVLKLKTFAPKSGGLYFSDDSYEAIMEVLGVSGVFKFQFRESDFGASGQSSYSFKLNN